jgi:putative FmdB family regulatory protein
MPLYEYECQDCHGKFDALVRSFSAADEVECQDCSSVNVKRLVSKFAVAGFDDPLTASAVTGTGGGGCCGGSCGCGN